MFSLFEDILNCSSTSSSIAICSESNSHERLGIEYQYLAVQILQEQVEKKEVVLEKYEKANSKLKIENDDLKKKLKVDYCRKIKFENFFQFDLLFSY